MYNGVLNIYKPKGLTSHDVVSRIRKIASMKKVGHTGTLDPMAEGVLPICLGKATRIAEYLTSEEKQYLAEITLGKETDTLDAEGTVIDECDLPNMEEGEIKSLLDSFLGQQMQKPPVYSAIKKEGKPLYQYARKGIEIDVPERQITILSLELVAFEQEKITILVTCSKGTYIRSLARDIARKMGSCGYLTYLQRTQSGHFHKDQAVTLEQLAEAGVDKYLTSIDKALPDMKAIILDESQVKKAALGNAVVKPEYAGIYDDCLKIMDQHGNVIALGQVSDGTVQPKKVFV